MLSTEPTEARSRSKNGEVEGGDVEGGVVAEERLCGQERNYAGIGAVLRRHRIARYQSTNVTPRSASPA